MRMPVQHEVGLVLEDRRGQAIASQERPDAIGLALQRLARGRVVQEHDPHRAHRDLG
jgi:hypothetical protein